MTYSIWISFYYYWSVLRTLSNIYDGEFCKNSFRKTLHFTCLEGVYHSNKQVIPVRYCDIYRLKSTPQKVPRTLRVRIISIKLWNIVFCILLAELKSFKTSLVIMDLKKVFSKRKYESYYLEIAKVYCSQIQFL